MNQEQIPSNLIPIYKSVPPFIKMEDGYFGFKGVILEDKVTGKIQCHLCGTMVFSVSKHLYHKHKDTIPVKYRKLVGLALTTPLQEKNNMKRKYIPLKQSFKVCLIVFGGYVIYSIINFLIH